MIEALNMQLDAVRTVLRNDVNEIMVCVDRKRDTGTFYTMIAITAAGVRRGLAQQLAERMFEKNSDFIGSFSYGDSLNLVFRYHPENLLTRREAMYAVDFKARKRMAESMLVALAEIQLANSIGLLLLDEGNINVSPEGAIYFNYFMDFSKWDPEAQDAAFYAKVSQMAFGILSREYEVKYDGYLPSYPSELQVFYKKSHLGSFYSFNAILTFIKIIPDEPREPAVGWRKVVERLKALIQWFREHSLALFLAFIVCATIAYAIYQIVIRLSYQSATKKSTLYSGMETVGEVYLGDENV